MLSKLRSGKCWIRLASYPLQYDMETDLDEIIRRFTRLHLRRMELANIQNPRKGDFRARVQINKNSRESKNFRTIFFPDNFRCILSFYGFKKVWFFYCSPPHSFQSERYRLTWDGKCENFSVLKQVFSLPQAQRGYSGFQVTGMIEWGQKSKPKKIPGPKFIPQNIPCQISGP